MVLFLNQLINGLHVGSIYALIALGYTMVYGIVSSSILHGDIIMVGAYTAVIAGHANNVPASSIVGHDIDVRAFGGLLNALPTNRCATRPAFHR